MKYTVLIVGAGKIGAFFDNPNSENVLTHAHGFLKADFSLIGFVDVHREAAENAVHMWGGAVYATIDDAFAAHCCIDVVCVAVSDDYHYDILKQIVRKHVKFVVAEKPLTQTLSQAEEIVDLYAEKKIPLLVNYTRRFVPEIQNLREKIALGQLGSYITGTGYYGKGILHNGSHLIDLLRYLVGHIQRIDVVRRFIDYNIDDPSVAGTLWFNHGQNFILGVAPCSVYTLFECDLLFEKARVRIVSSGADIEYYEVQENPAFKGYRNLAKTTVEKTSLLQAIFYMAQHVHDSLSCETLLICSAYDAYQTMKICLSATEQKSLGAHSTYEKDTTVCM